MQNYTNSDYALNKYSKGIVYRFADSIKEITLADYLAENPGKTERDFFALKELSDNIYLSQVTNENMQTRKNTPFDEMDEFLMCKEPSPEDLLISEIDAQEEAALRQERLLKVNLALDKLTEIQRKRYFAYHLDGLTMRRIAADEGVGHTKIQKSLEAAEKKIKKVLASN